MARLIAALEEDAKVLDRRPHALLGPPTFNIGIVQGGSQVNIVPESCVIEIDRRLVPGEELDEVWQSYCDFIASMQRSTPGFAAVVEEPMLQDTPLETAASEPVAAVASQVLAKLGLDSQPIGVPYGSDASKLARAGIPSIVSSRLRGDVPGHRGGRLARCWRQGGSYCLLRRQGDGNAGATEILRGRIAALNGVARLLGAEVADVALLSAPATR